MVIQDDKDNYSLTILIQDDINNMFQCIITYLLIHDIYSNLQLYSNLLSGGETHNVHQTELTVEKIINHIEYGIIPSIKQLKNFTFYLHHNSFGCIQAKHQSIIVSVKHSSKTISLQLGLAKKQKNDYNPDEYQFGLHFSVFTYPNNKYKTFKEAESHWNKINCIQTSMKEIIDSAKLIINNFGVYHPQYNNCYDFAIRFLRDIEVVSKSRLSENQKVIAGTGAVLTGTSVVVGIVLGAVAGVRH